MNLREYAEMAIAHGAVCATCRRTPTPEDIRKKRLMFDGWDVDGCWFRQRLFFHCPSCGHDTDLTLRRPVPMTPPREQSDDDADDLAVALAPDLSTHRSPQAFEGFHGGHSGGAGGGANWDDGHHDSGDHDGIDDGWDD